MTSGRWQTSSPVQQKSVVNEVSQAAEGVPELMKDNKHQTNRIHAPTGRGDTHSVPRRPVPGPQQTHTQSVNDSLAQTSVRGTAAIEVQQRTSGSRNSGSRSSTSTPSASQPGRLPTTASQNEMTNVLGITNNNSSPQNPRQSETLRAPATHNRVDSSISSSISAASVQPQMDQSASQGSIPTPFHKSSDMRQSTMRYGRQTRDPFDSSLSIPQNPMSGAREAPRGVISGSSTILSSERGTQRAFPLLGTLSKPSHMQATARSSDPINSSTVNTAPQPAKHQQSLARSVWKLPGLDKKTFYAAALYLHLSAKGQLRDSGQGGAHHVSQTAPENKDLLDRLADCFARSKSVDPQAHVSATAMTHDRRNKRIKFYISKNLSSRNMPERMPALDAVEDEDRTFAQNLGTWFNQLSHSRNVPQKPGGPLWRMMYSYNASRLEFYVRKIGEWTSNTVPEEYRNLRVIAQDTIQACKSFCPGPTTREQQLDQCATLAWLCQSNSAWVRFSEEVNSILHDDELFEASYHNFARLVKWVNYLGRLGAAYQTFVQYCTNHVRRDYTYDFVVLDSPAVQNWPATEYKAVIDSWDEGIALDEERVSRVTNQTSTTRAMLDEYVKRSRADARVHCEIQILKYFANPDVTEKSEDYIGCSKTSCWLCWQLLGHYGLYTTKDTHRMIYPMWAYPEDISESQVRFARALSAVNRDMLTLIEEKVLFNRDFSSRVNITHTSPRLIKMNDSPQVLTSSRTYVPAKSIASSDTLVSQGRMSVRTVSVLYFPVDCDLRGFQGISAAQVVDVDVFEWTGSVNRKIGMEVFWDPISAKKVVFSFQLNTAALLPKEFTVGEEEEATWHHWYTQEIQPSSIREEERHLHRVRYATLYRMGSELPANPYFEDVIKGKFGERYREGSMSFRGDIFVVPVEPLQKELDWSMILLQNPVKLKLQDFIDWAGPILTRDGGIPEYAYIHYMHVDPD